MSAAAPPKLYGAVLADPPWSFHSWSSLSLLPTRSKETHYQTMTLADIKALRVVDVCKGASACFLWVTDSHLDAGIEVLRAWGFKYRTIAFIWVKTTKAGAPKMGMGLWTRKEAEICLLGTRGKPKRLSRAVRQVIMEPRREHSRKPDSIRGRVEALIDGPYLELFSRRQGTEGWDVWGHEVDKFGAHAEAPSPAKRKKSTPASPITHRRGVRA